MHRERGVHVAIRAAIAVFYVVFALEHAATPGIALNVAIASAFIALAFAGYRFGLWTVVAGLAAHGLFDIAYPASGGLTVAIRRVAKTSSHLSDNTGLGNRARLMATGPGYSASSTGFDCSWM